ncbi:hypothetical protein PoB_003368800 [Plakobranchus ocellatus]|uniref:Uncharacterized protein n=1 Tax=Plakobranchus ocellatus TaxID=259542 RepID=A0AAV4AKX5_9GAST|nr:hypothetical protein PoB_003368800 [Plakobranchus ocellatus]
MERNTHSSHKALVVPGLGKLAMQSLGKGLCRVLAPSTCISSAVWRWIQDLRPTTTEVCASLSHKTKPVFFSAHTDSEFQNNLKQSKLLTLDLEMLDLACPLSLLLKKKKKSSSDIGMI